MVSLPRPLLFAPFIRFNLLVDPKHSYANGFYTRVDHSVSLSRHATGLPVGAGRLHGQTNMRRAYERS